MVLQRGQDVRIWGFANPKESIHIKFLEKEYKTIVDEDGNWTITIPPLTAGGPYSMDINNITIKDILIGDVWVCSGQSNMELPISRVTDMFREEVQNDYNPMIRHIKIPMSYNFGSQQFNTANTSWKSLTPENVMSFSAVAYFFAKDLYSKTNVPIGLINSSVGGSPIEAWISEDALNAFPKYMNEARICKSDEYIASVKNAETIRRSLWNTILNNNDGGVTDKIKWYSADYDDTLWAETDLFSQLWHNNTNGSFWFRKEVDIPARLIGKDAILRFGCIVDADSIFINGVFVGSTSYQYPPRIYRIPANVLKEGKNVVAVRLISYSGRPGFVKDKPYKIVFDKEEIKIEKGWKFKRGCEMPELAGETFFQYKPVGLYNAMIAPLTNYAISGAIWYQGEANTSRPNEYSSLLSTLIEEWRKQWQLPQLPFLIVQLPNFMKESNIPVESNWAQLREEQRQTVLNTPNTALIVTTDVGEWNDIHPLNKKAVGRRLSLAAQNLVLKNEKIVSSGPIYKKMEIEDNRIILEFTSTDNGIEDVAEIKGFTIAGKDRKYVWAQAQIIGRNKIAVWNDDIEHPEVVRYAWENNPQKANLKNKEGLPASPFTTDTSKSKNKK